MPQCSRLLIGTALTCVFGFALHAQAPSSAQSRSRSSGQPSDKVTLTGCVERADQMSGAATATTTVDSLSFVLIDATSGGAAEAPKGTAGTTASTAKGSMYRLAGDMSKLNPHVGHKVEVTGTIDQQAKTSGAPADTPSPSSAPQLKVVSLKMLAETCAR